MINRISANRVTINMINVQIVYALPHEQTVIACQIDEQATVLQAITQSHILTKCHISLADHSVGIYGRLCELTEPLKEGDRIEIYRPLINDPKEIRRKKAALRRNR